MAQEREMTPLLIFALSFVIFSISSSQTGSLVQATFVHCYRESTPLDPPITTVVYCRNATMYTSILESSMQNLRFNTTETPKPRYIITPPTYQHVQAAVNCAQRHGLQIRVRSGGHDYEGLSYKSSSPFIIVDLVNLAKILVDVNEKTAWVEAGATIGQLCLQIHRKSRGTLGFPAGVGPTMGVGGHISGGGQGNMMRKYGLSADNVIDALLVNVRGDIVDRRSMGEDLFWALCGGGGSSFGVILSFKIKLAHVPPKVTVFTITKTLEENATSLIHRWQKIADKLPIHLFIRLVITPDNDSRGLKTTHATFIALYLGPIKRLMPIMDSRFPELCVRPENCQEMNWIQSVMYFSGGFQRGEPITVLKDRNHRTKGSFIAKSDFVTRPIPEQVLAQIWNIVQEGEGWSKLVLDPYGGKMAEIAETAKPFPHRDGVLYNIQYYTKWHEVGPEAEKRHVDWINNIYNFMTPYVSENPRAAYMNYKDLSIGFNKECCPSYYEARGWGHKYFKGNFERLARIKARVDPENYFRNEQSIPPLFDPQPGRA